MLRWSVSAAAADRYAAVVSTRDPLTPLIAEMDGPVRVVRLVGAGAVAAASCWVASHAVASAARFPFDAGEAPGALWLHEGPGARYLADQWVAYALMAGRPLVLLLTGEAVDGGHPAIGQTIAVDAAEPGFTPTYAWDEPVKDKILKVAKAIYGADDVAYSKEAEADLKTIARLGLDGLPVCIAKTPASLSDNAKLVGRPSGFTITVREIEIAAGAGFLVPITGAVMRMPGLPREPAAKRMGIDDDGQIFGLS